MLRHGLPSRALRAVQRPFSSLPRFTREEVAKHCTRGDCWVIVDGKVHDVTSYLPKHPGEGSYKGTPLLDMCGKDATAAFRDEGHSGKAVKIRDGLVVGEVGDPSEASESTGSGGFLSAAEYKTMVLRRKRRISPTSWHFVFDYGDGDFGLPVGNHVLLKLGDSERKYTPIASGSGSVHFAIKVYPTGDLTPKLEALEVGDSVEIRGPHGSIELRDEKIFVGGEAHDIGSVGLVAGGSGITPILQVLRSAPKTGFSLVYANRVPEEIWFRDELEGMAAEGLALTLTVDEAPSSWVGSTGFVDESMLKKALPQSSSLLLACGPEPLVKNVLRIGEGLGHKVAAF
mmetsp:Transcript_37445/g.90037  ORF Transcript_37445/g.90037 Transcript_37445/m.90037 type:complete len:343 (-) Transcript_37445:275-1303(-)